MHTRTKQLFALLTAAFVAGLIGCSSNLPAVASSSASAPPTMTFEAPLEKVWAAAQGVLAAEATFKVLDKGSAIMVTEFKTIDSRELSLIGTYFLGKTYKNNYTVTFLPAAAKTTVRVNVGVQAQQFGFLTREAEEPAVSGHLRLRLFEKISDALK